MHEENPDPLSQIETELMHLARFALDGRSADALALLRRLTRRSANANPNLHGALTSLLANEATRTLARGAPKEVLPVDSDSRLELLRVGSLEVPFEPQWEAPVATVLQGVLDERQHLAELSESGLYPTRSLLFTGPPGVGKTLAAGWIAKHLSRPIYTLDLSAVMSSFLGRTGTNLRVVLDFARRRECVLLLDEFDAIAKRRDDTSEIGELKRLVTVLLQAIDNWPVGGLLIAATNHSELLDPAVWRRFDQVVSFPLPSTQDLQQAISGFMSGADDGETCSRVLAAALAGKSFSDGQRAVNMLRRRSIVKQENLLDLIYQFIGHQAKNSERKERIDLALRLTELPNISQRKVSELTHVSRDTIRRQKK